MHRHGYVGRKLGRERDQRRALMRGLAISLVEHHKIETTLPKAKELRRYVEKLITKAKTGTLADRRLIISALDNQKASMKLVDQIAPQLAKRNGGYLRIKRTRVRVGDAAQLASISFVDDITVKKTTEEAAK